MDDAAIWAVPQAERVVWATDLRIQEDDVLRRLPAPTAWHALASSRALTPFSLSSTTVSILAMFATKALISLVGAGSLF